MLNIFQSAIKFEYQFLAIFLIFFWIMSFIFYKLAPQNKHFKVCFKSFLIYSSAKDSLRSAKYVVFSLFCILGGRPMGGYSSLAPWLRYWIQLKPYLHA